MEENFFNLRLNVLMVGAFLNINRMPIWGIRTVVAKTPIKQIPWSVSI